MNITMLPMANRLDDERRRLTHLLQLLGNEGALRVSIDGNLLDDDMLVLVRPVVSLVLRKSIACIELDLGGIGIEVDAVQYSS